MHIKSTIQQNDTFHYKAGLEFKEESSEVVYLEQNNCMLLKFGHF
jgi:hypothetical protein